MVNRDCRVDRDVGITVGIRKYSKSDRIITSWPMRGDKVIWNRLNVWERDSKFRALSTISHDGREKRCGLTIWITKAVTLIPAVTPMLYRL